MRKNYDLRTCSEKYALNELLKNNRYFVFPTSLWEHEFGVRSHFSFSHSFSVVIPIFPNSKENRMRLCRDLVLGDKSIWRMPKHNNVI